MPDASHAAQAPALRVAICGARGGPVDVAVNGRSIGGTGELHESGVMHRDDPPSMPSEKVRTNVRIRGVQILRDLKFEPALLRAGPNVIELTKQARSWVDGVLCDYLRPEADDTGP